LYIKKRVVQFTADADHPDRGTLVKYSEIKWVVSEFLHETESAADASPMLNANGLTIGMSFHQAHPVAVAWAAAPPDHASPETLAYTILPRKAKVEQKLRKMFATDGNWHGYVIGDTKVPQPHNNIYIMTTMDPFVTNHPRDVHFVPVVVIAADGDEGGDFGAHYSVGIATYSRGESLFTFDSQMLAWE